MAPTVQVHALVGRERELAALDSALTQAAGGTAAVVAVGGEPGIGKTRLLSALGERAEAAGHLVLSGRAAEFGGDEPFAVFVDALDKHMGAIERQLAKRLGSDVLGELAAVFPALAELGYAPASALESERYRTHRAMRALLETLASQRAVVLVLDDLQWADEASIELLGGLVRRRPAARVLLVCALRYRKAPRRLVEALAEGVVRVALHPLDSEAARAMLGRGVDDATANTLMRESGGVPFYLEQLARAPRGGPASASRAGADVPLQVARALAGEIEALGESARNLARGAAVAGDPFDPLVAAAAAGLEEAKALALLDELVAVDLVRETDVPRRMRFRHPIVRNAVYESAGPGWRLAAHRRAADALADVGAPPVARAHHLAAAARPGDQGAVEVLAEAGQATTARAPAVAAHWFGEALRLLPEDDGGWRLGLLGMRAGSLAAAGRLEESRAALLDALPLVPPEASLISVRLTTACAWAEHLLGRHADAEMRLLSVLGELPEQESLEAAALNTELAAGRLFTGDFEGAVEPARAAKEAATALGDPMLAATATALLGFGDLGLGRMDAARTSLGEAGAVVDGCDDQALAARIDAPPFFLGHLAHWAEQYADGLRWFERGIAVSRLSNYGHVMVPLMAGQAHTLVTVGRLEAADKLASATLDSARLSGNPHDLAWALWVRCWVSLHVGDLPDALRAGEESAALVRELDHSNACVAASWSLGSALLEAGEPERAAEVVLEIAGGRDLPLLAPAARCIAYEVLTRSALARGEREEAADWAARAGLTAVGLGDGVAAGLTLRARAAVELAEGRASDAAATALAAAACAAGRGAVIEAARARILAGRALAAAGDDRAVDELEAARQELAACKARRLRDEAARELRRLGHRVARAGDPSGPRSGPGSGAGTLSLSRREREIAELVAEGRTNKQIAATLYISENTVESHLRRVFSKLGVSKRAALAAALTESRIHGFP